MYSINFLPILISSVVAFGLGAFWYSPFIFGREWMTLTKISKSDMMATQAKGVWKSYLIQFIATFVTFAVLGFLISASGANSAADGAFLGIIVWIGFVLTDASGALLWERKPMKLILINTTITLMTLLVGGAIIGAWR
ncbi:MAG: DUF1761 domain-containing protein [Candidatus Paceibacterota bacterium]|jgi:hypothetical protein